MGEEVRGLIKTHYVCVWILWQSVSYKYAVCLHPVHSFSSPSFLQDPQSTPFTPSQIHVPLILYNPASPIVTNYIHISVGLFTELWAIYRGPHPWRKLIFISQEDVNCQSLRVGESEPLPSPSGLLACLRWSTHVLSLGVYLSCQVQTPGFCSLSAPSSGRPLFKVFTHKGMLDFCQKPLFITEAIRRSLTLRPFMWWFGFTGLTHAEFPCVPGVTSTSSVVNELLGVFLKFVWKYLSM